MKLYETLELEAVKFEARDIITASVSVPGTTQPSTPTGTGDNGNYGGNAGGGDNMGWPQWPHWPPKWP